MRNKQDSKSSVGVEISAESMNSTSGNGNSAPDVIHDSSAKSGIPLNTESQADDPTDELKDNPKDDPKDDPNYDPKDHVTPDDVIHQLGGCGTFQVLLVLIVHAMKTVVCWSMMGTAFFAFTPRWRCSEDVVNDTTAGVLVALYNRSQAGNVSVVDAAASGEFWNERCETTAGKMCTVFEFEEGTKTLVTEFKLICDQSWVPATITSLQMVGMCVGSVLSGQLADLVGRKIPLFFSMVLLFAFHLMSYFATSWVMLGVARVFIGIGCAFYVAICYTIMVEYSLSKWRAVVTGLPSWAVESCMFALVTWLLRDWKHVTLVMIIISLVTLLAWFYVPESFRWYITQNKYHEAEAVVQKISRINKHPAPDFRCMRDVISKQEAQKQTKKYSVFVLFRRLSLLKITFPLSLLWCTMGMIAYGINFAIQKLSGDIYLNIFLFSIASTPAKFISIFLQNRFGRRFAAWVAFIICLVGGLVVGTTQYIDTPYRESLTNYCALAASAGVDGAWGPVQTHTLELYPTVIRNTGFGFVSVLARIGAVIGPQFVYLSEHVPGLLFFMVAVMSLLSIVATGMLPETRNTTIVDRLGAQYKRRKEDF